MSRDMACATACSMLWLAPWLAPCYGSRQPTLYLLAMIWPLLLVRSLHSPLLKRRDNPSEVQRRASKITMVMIMHHGVYIAYPGLHSNAIYPLSPLYSVSSCSHSHSQAVCGIGISSSKSTVSCINFSPSTLCLFSVFASDVVVRFKSVGGVRFMMYLLT